MHNDHPTQDAITVFTRLRPRLFGIAYRMIGSAAEAEDIVQDTWLRWQTTDRVAVRDPSAFLATITTRLSINVAQSAHARKQTYIGSWLPEPVATASDPYLGAERAEALTFAVLLLMERLSATERAAYILREAFDYSYEQIAEILQITEPNTRQLVSRARKHIADQQRSPAAAIDSVQQQQLLQAFLAAAQQGDLPALEQLFAAEVLSSADGGGIVRAARVPVSGRTRVAQFLTALAPHFWRDLTVTLIEANAQPAALLSRGHEAVALATIEASPEGIHQILWIMRPSKLKAVAHLLPIQPPENPKNSQ